MHHVVCKIWLRNSSEVYIACKYGTRNGCCKPVAGLESLCSDVFSLCISLFRADEFPVSARKRDLVLCCGRCRLCLSCKSALTPYFHFCEDIWISVCRCIKENSYISSLALDSDFILFGECSKVLPIFRVI